MPRPIVRYGAPKTRPNNDRHASIPSRYGKYKDGGEPQPGQKHHGGGDGANAGGPAWIPGKTNPRKLSKGALPKAVAPRRTVPRRESMSAREYWRREAAKRERLPIGGNSHGSNPDGLGGAGSEGGLEQSGGGGAGGAVAATLDALEQASGKQAERLTALQAQLNAANMAARLQAANAQNTALLEHLNAVSLVGSDLRTSLAAPSESTADWPQQPAHPSGNARQRRHSPKVMQQPLYAGYPNVATKEFRRSLPLDTLLERSGAASKYTTSNPTTTTCSPEESLTDACTLINVQGCF